jgi:hypothetical protein
MKNKSLLKKRDLDILVYWYALEKSHSEALSEPSQVLPTKTARYNFVISRHKFINPWYVGYLNK